MNNIIEGINVINKTPIKEPYWMSIWLLLLGGAFVSIFGTYVWFKKNNPKTNLGKTLYISGIIIMFTCFIPAFITNKETGKYTYKCTMEDNVSANYISDNFNIISIENGVWTIQDKEK